jgi:hypothetical protein
MVRHERPDVPRAVIAEEQRTKSARAAAIDGAVAGSPFLIALVPGYIAYLRQEARMLLRTATHGPPKSLPRYLPCAASTPAVQGFPSAPESPRTSTDHTVHKALNLECPCGCFYRRPDRPN